MMSISRTGRRFLSLLMTLCLTLSLFAGLGVGAYAAADDSWVGADSFDYTLDAHGAGWTWDAGAHTLTLSGVNAARTDNDGIRISGNATLVLEGANAATENTDSKHSLRCTGDLTIKGSGTLDASASGNSACGILVEGHTLTIESGYIKVTGDATAINAERVVVIGGYVSVESSEGNGIHCNSNYSQSGGYVRTNSSGDGKGYGLVGSLSVSVSGGYLDTKGGLDGIAGHAFSNTGGVVKAEGKMYGLYANGTNGASFTGGVTMAKTTNVENFLHYTAIYGTVSGSDDLGWYDNTNGTLGAKTALSTQPADEVKSIVIAKEAYGTNRSNAQSNTLDGLYIYAATGVALTITSDTTVSGGCYLEGSANGLLSNGSSNNNVTVNGTLVCIANGGPADDGEGFNIFGGTATVGTDATLYGEYKGTNSQKAGITADGGIVGASSATGNGGIVGASSAAGYDVIGVTNGTETQGIWASVGTSANPIKGNVIAVNTSTTAGNSLAKGVYVGDGGTVTAVSAGSAPVLGIIANCGFSVAGTGRLTAVSTGVGTGTAYSGPLAALDTDMVVCGSAAVNSPLKAATYDDNEMIYKEDIDVCKVLYLAKPAVMTVNDALCVDFETGWNAAVGSTDLVNVELLADWTATVSGSTTSFGMGAGFGSHGTDSANTGSILVPSGAVILLDLNGHDINRNSPTSSTDGCVLRVRGDLTLSDATATGEIKGGHDWSAGGVVVNDGGCFTMTGGRITGNTGDGGDGSGVYVDNDAIFTMTGGSITGNTGGAGVYVMTGTGSFNISVAPVVTGNTSGGAAKNIYLPDGKKVTVTSALNAGANLGVTVQAPPTGRALITVAQSLDYLMTDDDAARFHSDDTAFTMRLDDSAVKLGAAPVPAPGVVVTPDNSMPVIVDGKEYDIGSLTGSGENKTVKVGRDKLSERLNAAGAGSQVIVTVPETNGEAAALLVVKSIEEMAAKEMVLEVKTGDISYLLPTAAIDTAAILKALGATKSADVPVKVSIDKLSADVKAKVKADIGTLGAELIGQPIDFTIVAEFGGKTTEVKNFDKYTSRVIGIPTAVDASKIATAVVVEDGAVRHVPTDVYQSGGKWYAKINSRTNSAYALINCEAAFADVKGLWYEAVVNEMASRMVIEGRDKDVFDGGADITRAEFAALVVRALGLPARGGASAFKDVPEDVWYYGAVSAAFEYGLIEGRGDGVFDPLAPITRQEAMQVVFSAAKLAEYAGKTGELSAFTDAASVSGWAKAAAEFNVGSGLVQGDAGVLSPGANITRAESSTIVLRLLQKANLVDIRAEA